MTVDYTKGISNHAKSKGKKPKQDFTEPLVVNSEESKEPADYICTKCYEIDKPIIIEKGGLLEGIIPYKLYTCRSCGKTNSMVEINSREGKHAFYWHTKKHKGSNKESF